MSTVRQLLAAAGVTPLPTTDGREAARVEQAVAWMFGMCPSPLVTSPFPTSPSSTEV
jgi:UDP-N-acetylglucosamine 2-epimerase (non-hydrolysing)